MFGKLRTKVAAFCALAIIGAQNLAQKFNTNSTGPTIKVQGAVDPANFATSRKPAFRTGIKGIKGTNNTRYGAVLRHHFDSKPWLKVVA